VFTILPRQELIAADGGLNKPAAVTFKRNLPHHACSPTFLLEQLVNSSTLNGRPNRCERNIFNLLYPRHE
jgi:hypothetical protein